MAKQKEVIGMDIGGQAIKLVRLRKKKDAIEIVDYKIINRAKEDIVKEDIYKETIPFIKNGTKGTVPVIASIEGSHVFTRVFKLPAVGKGKLSKIIGYEAQQQVPFPISEVVWSYQCLQMVSAEEADVILSAVKKDIVMEFLDYMRKVDIPIDDVVAPITGLYHLLKYRMPEQPQAVMILDMGARTTNTIIMEKQNLWERTVPLGGEVITQAIAQEFNLTLDSAQEVKKEKGRIIFEDESCEDNEAKRLSSCIMRSITRLVGEIARSMEVYSSGFNSAGIKQLFLIGGASGLPNLDQFLAKKFRMPVENLDVLSGFDINPGLNKTALSKDSLGLGTALGLSLQGLGLAKLKLSLMPKELVRKKQWQKSQTFAAVLGTVLVILGVSFYGYNAQLMNIYKADIRRLLGDSSMLNFNKEQLKKTQMELDTIKEDVDIIGGLINARTLWQEALLLLEELVPQDVWLVGIEPVGVNETKKEDAKPPEQYEYIYGRDYIDLKLSAKTAGTYQQVVTFQEAVDKSGYFINGETKVVSANPPQDGVRDFVIQARLKTR